jgi:hypothetical protein
MNTTFSAASTPNCRCELLGDDPAATSVHRAEGVLRKPHPMVKRGSGIRGTSLQWKQRSGIACMESASPSIAGNALRLHSKSESRLKKSKRSEESSDVGIPAPESPEQLVDCSGLFYRTSSTLKSCFLIFATG